MDPLWLLLLLPVAAASGWYAARREPASVRGDQSEFNLPSAYFKGLNFLLNEQPDKAIEVFIKVLEVDSETVEMHLTLGNLFRRRGEIERATRIHQNLIARPNLSKSQRLHALYELAQDYFKAGLFDRAESLFQELSDVPPHAQQALRYLVQIYEREKEWQNAINVMHQLADRTADDKSKIVAHYYCELAQEELDHGHYQKAKGLIERALNEDPHCVRATIQLGDAAYHDDDFRRAIKYWRRVVEYDPRFLGEVIDKIVDGYRRLEDVEGLRAFLNEALDQAEGPSVLLALVDEIERRNGRKDAVLFLSDRLQKHPSVYGLRRLLELQNGAGNDNEQMRAVQILLASLIDAEGVYRCRQCGFTGRSLHWQCPGCKGWDTNEPIKEEHVVQAAN